MISGDQFSIRMQLTRSVQVNGLGRPRESVDHCLRIATVKTVQH
ncbi:hypothetical protein SynPROS91_00938 [Synechococcus sp. PROS-9-1]|nr:hypothetical protein SynPROS91_00938 [Synechococcus sp. PROS-9-1]